MKENITRSKIKQLLAESGKTITEVAKGIQTKYPDSTINQQSISSKLMRETIKFVEVEQIADICGYDVVFQKRNSTSNPDDKPTQDNVSSDSVLITKQEGRVKRIKQSINDTVVPIEHHTPTFRQTTLFDDEYRKKMKEDFDTIKGKYDIYIIAGERAHEAAYSLKFAFEKVKSFREEAANIAYAQQQYDVIIRAVDDDEIFLKIDVNSE